MEPARYLEMLVDFGNSSINCGSQFVGAEIDIEIKDTKLKVIFPQFVRGDSGHEPTFSNTSASLRWGVLSKTNNGLWSPHTWLGDGDSQKVSGFSTNMILVRSIGTITTAKARVLRSLEPEWAIILCHWLEVTTWCDLEDDNVKTKNMALSQAYYVYESSRDPRPLRTKGENMVFLTTQKPRRVSINELENAANLSAQLEYPPGYYLQLLSALKHFNEGRYRHSLLDSATAFEMAETELLAQSMSNLTGEARSLIEDSYNQIIRLRKALSRLNVPVPTEHEVSENIATPRNKAIHEGEAVGEKTAKQALDFAKRFIYTSLPT